MQKTVDEVSGIYYLFDDIKEESWTAVLENGTKIPIRIQITIENSDVHGVLASWEHNGTTYTLWEDSARDLPDAVAKMAIALIQSNCN